MEFLTKSLMPYKNSFKCKIKKQEGNKKNIFTQQSMEYKGFNSKKTLGWYKERRGGDKILRVT